MGKRKDVALLRIPVKLPADVSGIEIDYDQSAANNTQVYVTFKKDDGTVEVKKGNMPALALNGLTMPLA